MSLATRVLAGFALAVFLLSGYSNVFAAERTKQTKPKGTTLLGFFGLQPCPPVQRWGSESSVPELSTHRYNGLSTEGYRTYSQPNERGGTSPSGDRTGGYRQGNDTSESSFPGQNGSSSNGSRTDSQRLFAGGGVTPRGAAIGMETFGDSFGSLGGNQGIKGSVGYAVYGGEWYDTFNGSRGQMYEGEVYLKVVSSGVAYAEVFGEFTGTIPTSSNPVSVFRLGEPSALDPCSHDVIDIKVDASAYASSQLGISTGVTFNQAASTATGVYSPSQYSHGVLEDARLVYNYEIPSASLVQYALGRVKISENMSPIPQDRLIFDYSFFKGVPLADRKSDVHRFTPGFEKTLFREKASFEMRFPMGVTINNTRYTGGGTDLSSAEFGDITMYLKGLLYQNKKFALSAGLGLTVPTADDIGLYNALTGDKIIGIKNETVHLMPFVGMLWTPNDKWFAQAFAQWDADANGNVVSFRDFGTGQMTRGSWRSRDLTYQYLSVSVGRWLYKNEHKRSGLTAMNLMGELHWTKSLDYGRDVRFEDSAGNSMTMGSFGQGSNVLNMTVGSRMVFGQRHNVGLAFCTPLTKGDGRRQFDGEFRLTYNFYF